ncbi:hypothetical protein D3C76_1379380 [compost metagenome]
MVLGGAVGGGNQHGGDLWIGADLTFQHRQIQTIRIEASLDRHLHVSHQRRAFRQFATALKKHRQRHARRQRWHLARYLFPSVQQQSLQALGQACHVQGLGQVGGGGQRQGLTYARTVVTAAHENEGQRWVALALTHAAQHIQTIDAWQLPVGDDQVVRV